MVVGPAAAALALALSCLENRIETSPQVSNDRARINWQEVLSDGVLGRLERQPAPWSFATRGGPPKTTTPLYRAGLSGAGHAVFQAENAFAGPHRQPAPATAVGHLITSACARPGRTPGPGGVPGPAMLTVL
jgi:hypothetical protein